MIFPAGDWAVRAGVPAGIPAPNPRPVNAIEDDMDLYGHLRTIGGALKGWAIASAYDALAVGVMWLIGLLLIGVPWAPLWALLGALLQVIPHFGPVLALILPALVGLFSGGFYRLLWVLSLYAVIVVVEGFLLQPMFLKRRSRVPVWASVLVPLVLGLLFNFWGVLLAPPLLAIGFAYRERFRSRHGRPPSVSTPVKGGEPGP